MNDSLATLRAEIARIVTVIKWLPDGQSAHIECPGGPHDSSDGSPAMVWLSPVPHAHCFHEKCKRDIYDLNQELACFSFDGGEPPKPDPEQAKLWKKLRKLKNEAKRNIRRGLANVTIEQWLAESPIPVSDLSNEDQFRVWMETIYEPDEIVWTGEKNESGEGCELNFRTAKEWVERGRPYGQLVAAYPFWDTAKTTGNRTLKMTHRRKLLVLESDEMTIEQFGGVIQWMQQFCTLRSIVLTGGKSAHAGFDPPVWKPQLLGGAWGAPAIYKGKRYYRSRVNDETWEQYQMRLWGRTFYLGETDREARPADFSAQYDAFRKTEDDFDQFFRSIQFSKDQPTIYSQWHRRARMWEDHDRQESAQCQAKLLSLYAILHGLGCDRGLLISGLTTRVPGVERLDQNGVPTGRFQRLIYLNHKRNWHEQST